jgi:hypothetical protein
MEEAISKAMGNTSQSLAPPSALVIWMEQANLFVVFHLSEDQQARVPWYSLVPVRTCLNPILRPYKFSSGDSFTPLVAQWIVDLTYTTVDPSTCPRDIVVSVLWIAEPVPGDSE